MRASELIDRDVRTNGEGWAVSTLEEATRLCAPFVELMGDPRLGDIDSALVRGYAAQLEKLPSGIRKDVPNGLALSLADLQRVESERGLSTMPASRSQRSIAKIGEAFAWAKREE